MTKDTVQKKRVIKKDPACKGGQQERERTTYSVGSFVVDDVDGGGKEKAGVARKDLDEDGVNEVQNPSVTK